MSILESIIFEIVKLAAGNSWKTVNRSEKALKIQIAVGMKIGKPEPNFDSVYAYTLIEYGIEQPRENILNFFRKEDIRNAFIESFRGKDDSILHHEAEKLVNWDKIGDELRFEFARFTILFNKVVDSTLTPFEARIDQTVNELMEIVKQKDIDAIRLKTEELLQEQKQKKRLLDEYLEDVKTDTCRIDFKGIYSESGSGRNAISFPIEEHYTPLKTGRGSSRYRGNMAIGLSERVPLINLLSQHSKLLLIGEPGGGKTTFLRFIACVLAKDGLGREKPGRGKHLGISVESPSPVPILLQISYLARALQENPTISGYGNSWRIISQVMENQYGKEKTEILEDLLNNGGCTLLLDGLDEVADVNLRKGIMKIVNAIIHHWKNNLIIISSRPFGYHGISEIEVIATARIEPFGEDEILEFLKRWAGALFPDEEERSRKAYLPEIKSAVINVPRIKKMAKNPVMLTCLCVVHWNEKKLPEGKAELLAAVLRWLLNAKEDKRKKREYNNTFSEECFKTLALAMTIHPDGKQVLADLSWAAEQLETPFLDEFDISGNKLRSKGINFLDAEMIDSGIIEQSGSGQLRFWHYTFQEHYAARALVEMSDEKGPYGWWDYIKSYIDDRQWDEVLDHFAGSMAKTGKRRLHLLVERILKTADSGELTSVARAVGALGRILRILKIYEYKPPERLGWEEAKNRVMGIFDKKTMPIVPVEQRIAVAEALGQTGDPRFNPLKPEMLPIPGMDKIHLGKYLVTVEEYRIFIENKGYEDSQYWDDLWNIKKKENWTEPEIWDEQIEHSNWPVTGVSWYEAKAYCVWLSQRTGYYYKLPSIDDWEMAAANPKGEYPWGCDEPNPDLLNFDRNIGHPTPVGIYPLGATSGGHLDMSGNVWEWNEDTIKHDYRVIRGGCWYYIADFCRSKIHYTFRPSFRNYLVGFRISRSITLAHNS